MTRVGVWLAAGTALSAPYPCRCHESRDGWACANGRCPCWGRVDLPNTAVGGSCCAWRWPGLAGVLLGNQSAG